MQPLPRVPDPVPTEPAALAPGSAVGLIAGWGDYPEVVARRMAGQGLRVFGVGIAGHADRLLAGHCESWRTMGMGRIGAQTRFLRNHGVRQAVMAGKIFKSRLFQRGAWLRHLPDWTTLRYFWAQMVSGRERRNDDQMLLTVTRLFSDQGIEFMPATDFVPDLLTGPGLIAGPEPTPKQMLDVGMGWQLASELGRLDIGQSVAVKGRAVLAVEAIEGTDECIRRAGQLCTAGGFTVVKVAKPQQDMRFDVPTIGPGTMETMKTAGGRMLAIESGRTIVLGREEVVKLANRWGITVFAFRPADVCGPEKPMRAAG